MIALSHVITKLVQKRTSTHSMFNTTLEKCDRKIYEHALIITSSDLSCLKPQIQAATDKADMTNNGEKTALKGTNEKPLRFEQSSNSKTNKSRWKNAHISMAYSSEFSSLL